MTDAIAPQPPQTWGELGPAMRELTEKQRLFVRHLLLQKPGYGAPTRAYRAAGYGNPERPENVRKDAYALTRHPNVIAAIVEEGKNYIRGAGYAQAVSALIHMVAHPEHRDHGRAVAAVLDRVDPVISKQSIDVVHRHEDPDRAALEELKALRKLGTLREKLLEIYGENGLDRIELLEAAEIAQRAAAVKIIDGKVIEHANG
jgi:hypothetical protein